MSGFFIENTDNKEKYILVAVATGNEEAAWDSLDELADLLDTAGGEPGARGYGDPIQKYRGSRGDKKIGPAPL